MRKRSNSFPSSRRKTRGRGIAAPSQSQPDVNPPPEPLRAFVRLLARETARKILESGTAADPDPPTESTAPPAKPAAGTDS